MDLILKYSKSKLANAFEEETKADDWQKLNVKGRRGGISSFGLQQGIPWKPRLRTFKSLHPEHQASDLDEVDGRHLTDEPI